MSPVQRSPPRSLVLHLESLSAGLCSLAQLSSEWGVILADRRPYLGYPYLTWHLLPRDVLLALLQPQDSASLQHAPEWQAP